VRTAWEKRLNSPATSAVGRLFDGAAVLLGLLQNASFEGQGPMWLEATAGNDPLTAAPLPLQDDGHGRLIAEWQSLLFELVDTNLSVSRRAAQFHARLAATIVETACRLRQRHGNFTVGLSGGVFQNRRLTGEALRLLRDAGLAVHLPTLLPSNDGGLCAGQVREWQGIAGQDS